MIVGWQKCLHLICLPNYVSVRIGLFLLIGLNHMKLQNHETLSTQTLSTADICDKEVNVCFV